MSRTEGWLWSLLSCAPVAESSRDHRRIWGWGRAGFSLIPAPPPLLTGEFEGPGKACVGQFVFTVPIQAGAFGNQARVLGCRKS